MFHGISNGWELLKDSVRVYNRHRTLIFPLLIVWAIYAPIILYLKFWFPWEEFSTVQLLAIIFGIVFLFAFLLCFSSSILLELIQQHETGERMNLTKALKYTLTQNILRILPVVIVWTIVWFILLVIQALLSKQKKNGKESFSAENAAKTLAGYGSNSLSKAFFQSLEKGVRMIVFLILPAIAWENLGFIPAMKKGLAVFRANLVEFTAGFVLTSAATFLIFLPPGILFYIADEMELMLPDWLWVLTIIYIAFGWSYCMYLEQMFTAELYLWHHKWEKEVEKATNEGKPLPMLYQVLRPSLLDEVPDLLEQSPSLKADSS